MKVLSITILALSLEIDVVYCFWRMICDKAVVTARIDPIVDPGEIAGHTHAITGASTISYNSTYADLRAAECTTCQVSQDHSAYWVPQLYYVHQNGTYEAVNPITGITSYYLQRGSPGPAGKILAIPDGLRLLAGDPHRRSYNSSDVAQRAIGFSCLGGTGDGHALSSISNCPNGLRAEIFFPNCWDGVNLDSADHKSHVIYSGDSGNGACPTSHPVKIVSLFYEAMWGIDYWSAAWWNGTTPPFVFAQGDPTGYGLHGDFMSGWDADFLQTAVDTCTNDSGLIQDCPVFDIDYDSAGSCTWQGSLLTNENVLGTFGGLAALPGCNPVTWGPQASAANPTDCTTGIISNDLDLSYSSASYSASSASANAATTIRASTVSAQDTPILDDVIQSAVTSLLPLSVSSLATSSSAPTTANNAPLTDMEQVVTPLTVTGMVSSSAIVNTIKQSTATPLNQDDDIVYITVEEIEYITITSTVSLATSAYIQLYVIPKTLGQSLAAQQATRTTLSPVVKPSTVDIPQASTTVWASMEMDIALPILGAVVNSTVHDALATASVSTNEPVVVTKYVTTTIEVP